MKLIKNPNPGNKWFFCADCHKTFKEDEWYSMNDHRESTGHEIQEIGLAPHVTVEG